MCFDAAQGNEGKLLGRIYLDMHPREGKDKWFSSGPIVPGIRGTSKFPKACWFATSPAARPAIPA